MPPLPKKKTSRSRVGHRRMHFSAPLSALVTCPQCRSPRLPHHACPICGTYRGRQILAVEEKGRGAE